MAVSRKAMTEGIRTSTFGGTLNKARFYNPSVSHLRETREPAPFTQGSRGCSRTSAFFDGSRQCAQMGAHYAISALSCLFFLLRDEIQDDLLEPGAQLNVFDPGGVHHPLGCQG